jgi:hypothetical protein
MPAGGPVAPDGRQPKPKGVGKTAKRHDLEAPKTPGIGSPDRGPTDLQQGDVQRLEAAKKAVPATRPKQPTGAARESSAASNRANLEIPDAIDFAGQRKGQNLGAQGQGQEPVDMSQWLPLIQALASTPRRSGPLATALLQQLSNVMQTPSAGRVRVVDENAIQTAIEASYQ